VPTFRRKLACLYSKAGERIFLQSIGTYAPLPLTPSYSEDRPENPKKYIKWFYYCFKKKTGLIE
jgi:hypothetical protein